MRIHDAEQGSDEWFRLRAGLPTASEASKLITSAGAESKSMSDYAEILAGAKFAGRPLDQWGGNKHTERGHELEPDARQAYAFVCDQNVKQVGFCTDDMEQYGASPDGMCGDDGLVEIKCLSAKYHIKALMYYKKHNRAPTDYIAQCQMQMVVCERQWCDLTYWPRLGWR